MNVEIGTEASQFPEKEYIKWDFRCSVVLLYNRVQWFLQLEIADLVLNVKF